MDVTWSPETPRDDLDVTFEVAASQPVETAHWDFDGDGAFDDATGEVVVHAFEETGKKQVAVQVIAANGVATTHAEVLTIQQSAAFELTSVKTAITEGETAVVTFSVSNLVRDAPMDVKLALDLPDTGASITAVDGASVAGPGETTFVTVDPGQEETVRVRVQFTDPGTYEIGGEAVYYFDDGTTDDRRTESVDAITVIATAAEDPVADETVSTAAIKFPDVGMKKVAGGLVAFVVVVVLIRRL